MASRPLPNDSPPAREIVKTFVDIRNFQFVITAELNMDLAAAASVQVIGRHRRKGPKLHWVQLQVRYYSQIPCGLLTRVAI